MFYLVKINIRFYVCKSLEIEDYILYFIKVKLWKSKLIICSYFNEKESVSYLFMNKYGC